MVAINGCKDTFAILIPVREHWLCISADSRRFRIFLTQDEVFLPPAWDNHAVCNTRNMWQNYVQIKTEMSWDPYKSIRTNRRRTSISSTFDFNSSNFSTASTWENSAWRPTRTPTAICFSMPRRRCKFPWATTSALSSAEPELIMKNN